MAATDTKAAIAQIATQVQSIGQARAVLGVVTQVLKEGYEKLDSVSSLAGLRDSSQSLLDQTNAYAAKIYAVWTDEPDLQSEEISVMNQLRVATCLEQARENVRMVEEAAAMDFWNLAQLLTDSLANAVQIAKSAGNAVAQVVKVPLTFGIAMLQGLWPYVVLFGFGVVIFFWVRKRALKSLVT
jgi:hypothetical protein